MPRQDLGNTTGARTEILDRSTLWDLNDARTPEMIRRFYQNLAAGEAPSLALTNAQCAWLQSPAAAALTPGRRAALAGAWILESAGW
jgi:CHAT domain-containing protein